MSISRIKVTGGPINQLHEQRAFDVRFPTYGSATVYGYDTVGNRRMQKTLTTTTVYASEAPTGSSPPRGELVMLLIDEWASVGSSPRVWGAF